MKYIKSMLSVIFMIGVLVSPVEAGVLMISVQESYVNSKGKIHSEAYVERDRMRVEIKGDDTDQTIIFRKDKEVFWAIDNKEKTLVEITRRDLQKIKEKMDEAMKMFEEQLKNMPPEQREMMEQMMKKQMSMKSTQTKTMYEKVASGEKVNRWVCDKYEGYREGRKKKEIWTTDWKHLGLNPEDFKVMKTMGEFFEEFSKGAASSFYKVGSEEWEKEQGYSGVPVKTIIYSDGQIREKTELKEIQQQDFSASLFDLPKGLKKKEIPWNRMER